MGVSKPVALLSPAVGTGNVGDHFIELAIRRFFPADTEFRQIGIRSRLKDAQLEEINGSCCALLCGTNLYQHDWHSELTPTDLDRIIVPVIPFGVGSSAASLTQISVSRQTAEMIVALHDHCETGSVRDPHALAVVSALGIKNVRLTGCPVLFWAQQPYLPPVRPIPHEDVVITARNWLMHRWPDAVDHPVQIAFLDAVIKNLSTVPWSYAVHEDYDESLLGKLGITESHLFRGSTAEDFVSLYRDQKHVVLASRLHGGMLALANGVPAIFVGHDTRTYSFCELMGLDYVELFSDGAAEVASRRIRRILDGDASEFSDLNRRFQSLKQEMNLFRQENSLNTV